MPILEFLRRHGAVVAFGFGLTLLSGFGQTFFIALSGPDIRAHFGLSNGGFGAIYSAATLLSAASMVYVGGIIDRASVAAYGAVALLGLSAATFLLAAAPNVLVLGLALYLLRLFGQGMLPHAAITSTARLPAGVRGRAIGLALLGFSLADASYPTITVQLLAAGGWQWTWRVGGVALLAGLVLVGLARLAAPALGSRPGRPAPGSGGPGLAALLADWRFLAFLPAMLATPAIMTGYYFFQRAIADAEGWPIERLAGGFALYAGTSVVAMLGTGHLVDRIGALPLARFFLLPLGGASLVLALSGGAASSTVFFVLVGLSVGSGNVIVAGGLAELFGTERLGRVRSLAAALGVAASAVTPVAMGYLLDFGVPVAAIAGFFAAYVVMASLAVLAIPRAATG
jgi:MFS family permease